MTVVYIIFGIVCGVTSSVITRVIHRTPKLVFWLVAILNIVQIAVSAITGVGIKDFFSLVAVNILIYLSVCDVKSGLLPSTTIAVYAIAGVASGIFTQKSDFIYTIFFAVVVFLVLFFMSKKSKEGIGMGDVLILSATSLYNVPAYTMGIVVVSMVISMISGIVVAVKNRSGMKTTVPYMPFLTLAYYLINLIY